MVTDAEADEGSYRAAASKIMKMKYIQKITKAVKHAM